MAIPAFKSHISKASVEFLVDCGSPPSVDASASSPSCAADRSHGSNDEEYVSFPARHGVIGDKRERDARSVEIEIGMETETETELEREWHSEWHSEWRREAQNDKPSHSAFSSVIHVAKKRKEVDTSIMTPVGGFMPSSMYSHASQSTRNPGKPSGEGVRTGAKPHEIKFTVYTAEEVRMDKSKETDIGNSVIEGIISEPSLRPVNDVKMKSKRSGKWKRRHVGIDDVECVECVECVDGVDGVEDGVKKTDLDNPLLIASQGDLAHQLGLIESPKSLHQFRYRDARRLLMDKMDENHMEFIRDEARHCILNRRLPRRMTRREFAYRLLLLAFHCVLCSGSLPSFWGKIDKHRLVVWLPKSAETLTIRIAEVGYRLRVSYPALSIQRVLEEAVKLIASPDIRLF